MKRFPSIQRNSEERWKSYDLTFKSSLGIGYGRIRDRTFVFHALRIIERLQDDGLLIHPLNREQMIKLINQLAWKREYTTNFERFEKFFFQDIFDELIATGAISPHTITPFPTLRMQEAFIESVQPRFFGWRIYYAFIDQHDQSLSDREYTGVSDNHYHEISDDWADIHEWGAEVGHPLSLNSNFYASFTLELPNHEWETQFRLNLNTSISDELGES